MKVDLYSEEEILKGCRKNKRQYQEILYRKYAKKMYGICLSYAGDRALAQDMLQESFIKIFNRIKDFKQEGSLEGWIRKVVTNTAIDLLRQQKRIQNYISDKEEIKEGSYESDALQNLQTEDVLNQVNRLPEGARLVFNLYALEGYTHKEIAEKLNITEGTSKSQFNRARKLLMLWLNKICA
ncbi:MAG TPA: sigma-70 family RNA polymerase sigma factor [Bacteroidales bacterium]|nr:sigma-70 family RNA polymerase sigma factor [Bacteroidales bacterium]